MEHYAEYMEHRARARERRMALQEIACVLMAGYTIGLLVAAYIWL